jgi:uncharacterized protein
MTELPEWVGELDLVPNPEGGWFKEMWHSDLTISQSALPSDYTGPRSAGSAILLLLMPGQQSAWHTVRSAELWLHHRGSPLLLDVGSERDSATTHVLGSDIIAGEQPQVVVPPRYWQRATRATMNPPWSVVSWCLVSTTPTSASARPTNSAARTG